MAIDDVRLVLVQLRVIHASVPELLPFIANTGHPRQSTAHDFGPFTAHYNNPVPIVVQFSDRCRLERGKECHCDVAGIEQLQRVGPLGQFLGRPQGCTHHVFGQTPGRLTREMPKAIACMPIMNVLARTDAHPGASARVVVVPVERARRSQPLTARKVFTQDLTRENCRMQPLRRAANAPAKIREPFSRVVIRTFFALHAGHQVFKDVVDGFHVITAFREIRTAAFPAEANQRDASFHA